MSHNVAEPADQSDLPFWKRSHYLDRMTFRELVVGLFPALHDPDLPRAGRAVRGRLRDRPGRPVADARLDRGGRADLSARLAPAAPVRAAFEVDVEVAAALADLEAHPLRSSPGSERPLGAVRRAPHHGADHRRGDAADRLGDRRPRRRGGGVRHRPADDLLLRVHALHPAPRLQAEVELGAAHEAAPHGAPLLRRDRQLRDHQLRVGPAARHLLREEGPAAAARRPCSTSATTRRWRRPIRG